MTADSTAQAALHAARNASVSSVVPSPTAPNALTSNTHCSGWAGMTGSEGTMPGGCVCSSAGGTAGEDTTVPPPLCCRPPPPPPPCGVLWERPPPPPPPSPSSSSSRCCSSFWCSPLPPPRLAPPCASVRPAVYRPPRCARHAHLRPRERERERWTLAAPSTAVALVTAFTSSVTGCTAPSPRRSRRCAASNPFPSQRATRLRVAAHRLPHAHHRPPPTLCAAGHACA